LGKRQTVFGKKSANLSLNFGVSIVGEIEQQIFYATFLIGKIFFG
jgi:hypothetical protein